MIPLWVLASALDESVRCLYCPALYRPARRLVRPYICPVCAQDVATAARSAT